MSELKLTQFVDIARQQLIKEIIDNRVKDLDNWLQQCDVVWKEQHVLLPYPKYPDFPSDDMVMNRAKTMYQIQEESIKQKEANEKVIIEPMVEQPQEETGIIKINSEEEKDNSQNTEEIKIETEEKKLPPQFQYKRKK